MPRFAAAVVAIGGPSLAFAGMEIIQGTCNCVSEFVLTSGKAHADPFNDIELDIVATGPGGQMRVPGFWAGGKAWKVRFAPPAPDATSSARLHRRQRQRPARTDLDA